MKYANPHTIKTVRHVYNEKKLCKTRKKNLNDECIIKTLMNSHDNHHFQISKKARDNYCLTYPTKVELPTC